MFTGCDIIKAKVNTNDLVHLLTTIQRPQIVLGKPQNQIESCVLVCSDASIRSCSLVRDLTSLTSVSCSLVEPVDEQFAVPIANIDKTLGVLRQHGGVVAVEVVDSNKIRFKSNNKTTTIESSFNAQPYSHSRETLKEVDLKSNGFFDRITTGINPTYTTGEGEEVMSSLSIHVSSNEMYEGLRCDTINNQKLNMYEIEFGEESLTVEVGTEINGKTKTEIEYHTLNVFNYKKSLKLVYQGGLENVFKQYSGNCQIDIFAFPERETYFMLIQNTMDNWTVIANTNEN